MVRDEVEQHADLALLRRGDERVEVLERPELGMHPDVVRDVVAPVVVGRGHRRIEPDAVDAQPLEVVQAGDQPPQIAHAVAVRVREGPWIDLVQDALAPPRLGRHGAPAYASSLDTSATIGTASIAEVVLGLRRSTIAAVAAEAGVGVGTVSRVLNGSPSVSEDTRRRVLEAIATLDYQPSAVARALSTGRTHAVGVVAPFFTQPSVVERLRGMSRTLSRVAPPADPDRRRAARAAPRRLPLGLRPRPLRRAC